MRRIILFSALSIIIFSCSNPKESSNTAKTSEMTAEDSLYQDLLNKYKRVELTADLSALSDNQKEMIKLFIQVGDIMNGLFWKEAYGNKNDLMGQIDNERARAFARINYGPWDRLNNNESFVEGFGEKPAGANFYPEDMSKEEFEAADLPEKGSLYTLLKRDTEGNLITVPYHVAFENEVKEASKLMKQAAALAENEELKKYLNLRAEALLTDDYFESDIAWMDMKTNTLDLITGPIETYEDQLFGAKAAHETYVLVKDLAWSKRLEKYATFLPGLQKGLPVEEKYKSEEPGRESQLAAFDVIYYAGDCNAGSKTIAVNLPNDEGVQLEKGTRRSQLKNAMKAKFDHILIPIADELIDEEQRQYITFDAFFANTMFHEVAHGLGIKNTINGKGTVREALKENASALEEGKADILGLYMITNLHEQGEVEGDLMNYYTTFMASIFRSVRFGASSAHGKANMIRFNFFQENGAFAKDETTGRYKIDFEKMKEAMTALSEKILTLQGDGDYEGVEALVADMGNIKPDLQADLDRLSDKGIPVDIVFKQGIQVLGL
ncbi:Zn-dependent hydrolase [Fulvivirgaceae bacterium BMA10]|uniref:Zn-dependent hydrolase n=1 Tax=Splendidivirga corallicola TaxID=3051826 RepID=A0ABT8KYY4_9BACT|nr:Zn-dependent hydrolase [Fulvivirgaceae bacterium BMA10]